MRLLTATRHIVAFGLLAILTCGQPASAQQVSRDVIGLQNQILELRQQVQMLQDQVNRGGGRSSTGPSVVAPSGAGGAGELLPQLLTRVGSLEEQVRQLRGRIDETQNQLQQQNAELNKKIDDMAFQSQNPQAGSPPPGPVTRPPPIPQPQGVPGQPGPIPLTPGMPPPQQGAFGTMPPNALPPQPPPQPGQAAGPLHRTPEMSLQEGNAALARRDYPAAEQAAREVLANRTSPRAYDAQFLLAQALVGERQYSQAAIAYDDTYNRARKGAHAQDALLGLANSLIAINEKKAACDTLVKIHAEYPTPRPDLRDAIGSAGQRAGCR